MASRAARCRLRSSVVRTLISSDCAIKPGYAASICCTTMSIPIVHTVELLDWATGGPAPEALAERPGFHDLPEAAE